MAAVFISIDIGTTNTKGALIDQNGNLISQHSIRHVVQSSVPGWAEHNMTKDWWEDAVTIIHRLLDEYPGAASDVLSVMVSGMCPSIGITDDDGVPLRNGITQSDTREPLHGLDYYGIAPWDHSEKSTYIVPHLLWVKENEPEIYSQTRRLFFAHNYLYYKLTGDYRTDFNTACWISPLFNREKLKFDREVMDAIGLVNCRLPEVTSPIDCDSHISEEAAKITGLSQNTRVCVGTGDFYESLMSGGVRNPGDAMLYFGSVGLMFVMMESISCFLNKPSQLGMPGDPIQMGPIFPVSGILLEWFRNNFAKEESSIAAAKGENIFSNLNELAESIPIGADKLVLLPHFNGERNPINDIKARGVLYGLRLDHGVPHFYRAILESYCYSVRHALEDMQSKGELLEINKLSVSGGGAQSSLWRQMTSDVLRADTVYSPDGDETLAGCYLAALGIGYFRDLDGFYSKWLGGKTLETQPNSSDSKKYDAVFSVYKNLHRRLVGSYELLDDIE